jgi:uncharacterized protein
MSELVYDIDEKSADGRLFLAILRGDTASAALHIREGANIDWRDANWGNAAIHVAAEQGPEAAIKILVNAGANLELRDGTDMTPLMRACSSEADGSESCMRLLISAGALVNAVRESDDMTSLKFAVESFSEEGIAFMLASGARIDGVPGDRFTPLMLAARHDNAEAIEALVRHGADTSIQCDLQWALGMTAEQLAWLEKKAHAIAAFRRLRELGAMK